MRAFAWIAAIGLLVLAVLIRFLKHIVVVPS